MPSKGRYQGDIQRVSVEGREEMTCAEKACDAFILRVLRKEINLHSRPLINILWFPPPILAQIPRHKHISPVSPAFSRLNTSQRQVAAAMISTTEPVVIAHGTQERSMYYPSFLAYLDIRPAWNRKDHNYRCCGRLLATRIETCLDRRAIDEEHRAKFGRQKLPQFQADCFEGVSF